MAKVPESLSYIQSPLHLSGALPMFLNCGGLWVPSFCCPVSECQWLGAPDHDQQAILFRQLGDIVMD